jgi:RNA polymerase sigma-70 factor, ECF subfamily
LADESSSDGSLLDAFLAGDERAFAELVRRHEDRIFALALRITGDRGDALEATQETFITLWRRAATFERRAELGTWLYRVGMNAARDVLRRRKRFPLLVTEEQSFDRPDTRTDVEAAVSTRIDVGRALAALPPEYAEAVAMHDLGAIPYEEIAAITGVALGTVKSRISRGRRLLAAGLEHEGSTATSKDAR